MTGGQVNLNINDQSAADSGEINQTSNIRRLPDSRPPLRVIVANDHEIARHQAKLESIEAASGNCIWQAE
jgi:DNA polymerase-3 subunit epsilon